MQPALGRVATPASRDSRGNNTDLPTETFSRQTVDFNSHENLKSSVLRYVLRYIYRWPSHQMGLTRIVIHPRRQRPKLRLDLRDPRAQLYAPSERSLRRPHLSRGKTAEPVYGLSGSHAAPERRVVYGRR